MNFRSVVAGLTTAGMLVLAPLALRAEDPPNMPQGKEWCDKNPEKCAEMRQQREDWCNKHPEECAQMRQRRDERKAWCDANPQECAKQREQRRQRMEEMKAKCDADPAKCEEMKQQMRDRRKDRMEREGDGGPPGQVTPKQNSGK